LPMAALFWAMTGCIRIAADMSVVDRIRIVDMGKVSLG
jgi:hypothetical protein